MCPMTTNPSLEHLSDNVNPSPQNRDHGFPDSMIHHNVPDSHVLKERIVYYGGIGRRYGVSSSRRVLSPELLLKKYDYIRDCLKYVLGFTTAQREVTLRLLRYWAYYGQVYLKESQVTAEPGCSKATFWRTVRLLEELGLIRIINRYIIRPHAQISNLYRLDRLVVMLARYLAEHIAHAWDDWLLPWIRLTWPEFWSCQSPVPGERAGPGRIAF